MYWPLEQALHTDINYLLVSYEGHSAEIKMIFGASEPTPKVSVDAKGKPIVLSPAIFDLQFEKPFERRRKTK